MLYAISSPTICRRPAPLLSLEIEAERRADCSRGPLRSARLNKLASNRPAERRPVKTSEGSQARRSQIARGISLTWARLASRTGLDSLSLDV